MTLRKLRFTLTCLLLQKPFPHFEERKRGRSENLAQLRFDGCVGKAALPWLSFLRQVWQERFSPVPFLYRAIVALRRKGQGKAASSRFSPLCLCLLCHKKLARKRAAVPRSLRRKQRALPASGRQKAYRQGSLCNGQKPKRQGKAPIKL